MIFRIFAANFLTMGLPLLLVVAGILLVVRSRRSSGSRRASFWVGVALLSLPLGLFVYLMAGILTAVLRGEGHFYSVPFGGYSASNDAALIMSALFWTGLVFLCLAQMLRPRK